MPPKGKNEPPPGLTVPEVPEEVQLPEELADLPEPPPFGLVLGSLVGHRFRIREPPPKDGEGGDVDPAQTNQPPLIEFDPREDFVAKAKQLEDPLLKRVILLEREELQAQATAEEKTLTGVIRQRIERERAARSRVKANEYRKRAIAAHEAAKAEEAVAAEAATSGAGAEAFASIGEVAQRPSTQKDDQAPKADFVLLVRDYPNSVAELEELDRAGLCQDSLVDVWTTVYLTGETIEEAAAPIEAEGGVREARLECELPEIVGHFYKAIHGAAAGTDLANFTISTVRDTHTLAFPPEGVTVAEHVQGAIMGVLDAQVAAKRRFNTWLEGAQQVSVPDLGSKEGSGESRLYNRMMSSVDPSHHDTSLFLHCLTEQVERTLGGDTQRQEDEIALSSLEEFLGSSFDAVLTAGKGAAPQAKSTNAPVQAESSRATPADASEGPLLPHLDRAACTHHLGGGAGGASTVFGGEPVVKAVHDILKQVSVPGVKRSGLPEDAAHSAAQRELLKHRLYPFAGSAASSAELEQMALVHAFEELLRRAQPERTFCLADRSCREQIPASLLAQTLEAALCEEPMIDTAYLPRHDCLLIALHHRSLPGRVLWHSWRGDLFQESSSERWEQGLFTEPTFNDWSLVFGGGLAGKSPAPRYLLKGLDGRKLGYGAITEKLATPADGSLILVTRNEYGLSNVFPVPSNALLGDQAVDPLTLMDDKAKTEDDAISLATTAMAAQKASDEEAALGKSKYYPPAASSSRVARVCKDDLSFGMQNDKAWVRRLMGEQRRRVEVLNAAVTAAQTTKPPDASPAQGSRPQSPDNEAAVANARAAAIAQWGVGPDDPEECPFPFGGNHLGHFWLALPDGARCTARLHHELALPEGTSPFGAAGESVPSMGVLFTYTMQAGQVVQVFSDGAVQLIWPLALKDGQEASAGTLGNSESSGPTRPTSAEGIGAGPLRFTPGCAEDLEVSRTVMPSGTLIRKLLSGRLEVCHPDGTTASRNPTLFELDQRLMQVQREPDGEGSLRQEVLQRMRKVSEECQGSGDLLKAPSAKEKSAGLPGHWVVIQPDGRVVGRVPALQTNPKATPLDTVARASSPSGAGDASPVDSGAVPAEPQAASSILELLGAVLSKDGTMMEYKISEVPTACQVDLQTRHRRLANSKGLAALEDPHGLHQMSFHADGTRLTSTRRGESSYVVEIAKEPFAHISCEVDAGANSGGPMVRVVVDCADGARLDILPQMLDYLSQKPVPLDLRTPDPWSLSSHARVELACRGGSKVVSHGSGDVEVFTCAGDAETAAAGQPYRAYTAYCNEASLVLQDAEGTEFRVRGDQTLTISPVQQAYEQCNSPRCLVPAQAYRLPSSPEAPLLLPDGTPPPRLFVVYGSGDAEELLQADEVERLVQATEGDPAVTVIRGQPVGPPLEACSCTTILRRRLPDSSAIPPIASVMLDEGLDAVGNSVMTGFSYNSSSRSGNVTEETKELPAGITQYQQIIEYPRVSEETRLQFVGTLKQYRNWEAEQLAKNRAVMKKEEAKGKKDAKKEKGKEDKKAKKGKKGVVVEAAPEEEVQVVAEPAFIQDLQLTAFKHQVQVLRLRAGQTAAPSCADLLARALDARVLEAGGEDPEAVPTDAVALGDDADLDYAGNIEVRDQEDGGVGATVQMIGPCGVPGGDGEASLVDGAEADAVLTSDVAVAQPRKRSQQRTTVVETQFPFAYFKSEMGLQFLIDTGELDPERRRTATERPPKPPRAAPERQRPSPWNPRLVGEVRPEDTEPEQRKEQRAGEETPVAVQPPPLYEAGAQGDNFEDEGTLPFAPKSRLPIAPERLEAPEGPHPDKKSAHWNHLGEPRHPNRKKVSMADVSINMDYLEVEGATDRRVRTASIAHKKNAAKAPSVMQVRKTGAHAAGLGDSSLGAKEILGEPRADTDHDEHLKEHWKLTSSMQGLGDCNKLVEVIPGACRFGLLKLGCVYRMDFYLRNLDVDVTRFNIHPVLSPFVHVTHKPGVLAPGMATKISVEVAAVKAAKIEDEIQIKVKAHVIKVPVYANIYDAEEYERLDRESVALHGRKIGREWERRENNEPGPIRVVTDKEYCDKVKKAVSRILDQMMAAEAGYGREAAQMDDYDGGDYPEAQDDMEVPIDAE